MALSSKGGDERNNATKRQQLTGTLTSSPSRHALPLLNLPFELIEEILCRLPVKLLLQLKSACKSWNSLISDTKFHKKHLSHSTTHSLHCVSYSNNFILIKSYPLDSVFTNVTTTDIGQFELFVYFVGSCNGILCFAAKEHPSSNTIVRLWNPSIRKFKELPLFGEPHPYKLIMWMFGFGYDPVSDNYKVVAVLCEVIHVINRDDCKHEVKVHSLGTNSWKTIPRIPFVVVPVEVQQSGQCVSGTINWLASKDISKRQCFILSLDLGNESYQEVLLPNYGEIDIYSLHLSVLRDCLCIFSGNDIWLMKEYGYKESWTKLFTISYEPAFIKAIYVFEDEQVLLKCKWDSEDNYLFYNCRDGTSKFITSENTPEVCVESLISPCF